MLKFELKKMWRNRTVLWLFLFAAALVFFVNYRSSRMWLEDEYPFYSEDPMSFFYRNYMKVTNERYLAGISTMEMDKDFKRMEMLGKDYFALRKKIPLNFRGYSEEGFELEKIYRNQVELADELLKKHEISLSDSTVSDSVFKWAMFEKNYAEEHGVHIISNIYSVPLTNAARRILFNSRFLFGAPVMLCFLFLFGGILSSEREHGTEKLLMMQPRKRIHILGSKLLAVWCMALLYVLMLGVLLFVSFLWLELPIDGFWEIYRVMDPTDPLQYVVGANLLGQILLGFFMMVAFFTGLLFFLSSRSTDTAGTTVVVLVLSVFLYVLTDKFDVFRQPWNPVYALDYLQVINGRYARIWSKGMDDDVKVFYANGIRWYFLFGGGAVFFSMLSLLWKERTIRCEKKKGDRISSVTVAGMEKKKIFQTAAFYRMVLGVSALLILFFIFLKKEDENLIEHFQKAEEVAAFEEMLQRESKHFRKEQHKVKMEPMPQGEADPYIESLERNVRKMELHLQHEKNIREYYFEKKGTPFYDSMDKNVERSFDGYRISSDLFLKGQPTTFTQFETSAIFRKAAEDGISPVLVPNLYFSAYEEYTSPLVKQKMERKYQNRTHSAFHLPYRLIKEQKMDITFLIVISLIVLGGYVFDKENGEQLSLMYTEPVKRARYHWTKIAVAVGLSAGLFLLFFAVVFVLGWVAEGIGAWNFPVVNYLSIMKNPMGAARGEVMKTISLLPLWHYLLRVFLVIVAECFFLSSLSTFLSIFVKEKNRLLGGLALVVGGGVFLSNYLPQGILRLLSPFHYLQASTVANGSVKIFRNLPQESFWRSILILVVWGVILGILGAQIVKKRECV